MAPDAAIPYDEIDLDHVAVAVERWSDVWPRYRSELGGQWVSGGESLGFAAGQLRYANGMKLEVLQPANVHVNDFLRRFLDRNGPGPHHLTFKVRDIVAAIGRAEAAGYRPVGAQLEDPMWKEVFLHPKDAPGVVVQLAQSGGSWESPEPEGLPAVGPGVETASLDHVAHAVGSMDEGLRLFSGLLSGREVASGPGWVELGWRGPGRVRLVSADADPGVAGWLDGRAGRVLHLAFGGVGGGAGGVGPEDNCGTRLVFSG